MSIGLSRHEQDTENTVQDFLFQRPGTYQRKAAYTRAFKKELQRLGYETVMADYDTEGNCERCGEAGRCPGVHIALTQVPA